MLVIFYSLYGQAINDVQRVHHGSKPVISLLKQLVLHMSLEEHAQWEGERYILWCRTWDSVFL